MKIKQVRLRIIRSISKKGKRSLKRKYKMKRGTMNKKKILNQHTKHKLIKRKTKKKKTKKNHKKSRNGKHVHHVNHVLPPSYSSLFLQNTPWIPNITDVPLWDHIIREIPSGYSIPDMRFVNTIQQFKPI